MFTIQLKLHHCALSDTLVFHFSFCCCLPCEWALCVHVCACACTRPRISLRVCVCVRRFELFLCPTFISVHDYFLCACMYVRMYVCRLSVCMSVSHCCCCCWATAGNDRRRWCDVRANERRHETFRSFARFFFFLFRFFFSCAAVAILFLRLLSASAACCYSLFSIMPFICFLIANACVCVCVSVRLCVCVCWVCLWVSADPASSLTGLYACIGFFMVGFFFIRFFFFVVVSY